MRETQGVICFLSLYTTTHPFAPIVRPQNLMHHTTTSQPRLQQIYLQIIPHIILHPTLPYPRRQVRVRQLRKSLLPHPAPLVSPCLPLTYRLMDPHHGTLSYPTTSTTNTLLITGNPLRPAEANYFRTSSLRSTAEIHGPVQTFSSGHEQYVFIFSLSPAMPSYPTKSPSVPSTESSPSNTSNISIYGKMLIVVTTDSDWYVTVDITGAKNAAFVRECIFNKVFDYCSFLHLKTNLMR